MLLRLYYPINRIVCRRYVYGNWYSTPGRLTIVRTAPMSLCTVTWTSVLRRSCTSVVTSASTPWPDTTASATPDTSKNGRGFRMLEWMNEWVFRINECWCAVASYYEKIKLSFRGSRYNTIHIVENADDYIITTKWRLMSPWWLLLLFRRTVTVNSDFPQTYAW